MNYSKITDRMFLGGTPDADMMLALLPLGVTHVLNCQIEYDDSKIIPLGVEYCWDGTPDWTVNAGLGKEPKPVEWFKKGLEFWLPALGSPHAKLYVHCAAGANRSATMAWAFLRATGIGAAQCTAIIDSHRIVATYGTFFDHPWRVDAENALKKLEYL